PQPCRLQTLLVKVQLFISEVARRAMNVYLPRRRKKPGFNAGRIRYSKVVREDPKIDYGSTLTKPYIPSITKWKTTPQITKYLPGFRKRTTSTRSIRKGGVMGLGGCGGMLSRGSVEKSRPLYIRFIGSSINIAAHPTAGETSFDVLMSVG